MINVKISSYIHRPYVDNKSIYSYNINTSKIFKISSATAKQASTGDILFKGGNFEYNHIGFMVFIKDNFAGYI